MTTRQTKPLWANVLALLVCVGLPLALGAVAGSVTSANIPDWYASLHKPSWRPPNSLFAPVWTTLYVLMGISAFIVWRKPSSSIRTRSLGLFGVQLALNFAWSFIFFHFKWTGIAFLEMILLWIVILLWIRASYPLSRFAALLQIPYLAWVSFAAALNLGIYLLN